MESGNPIIIRGITRTPGLAEGEALVTTEKLSHLINAVDTEGVIRMFGHPLQGKSYASKILVYDTDKFSTGGAWGLYFKCRIRHTGPLAMLCRTVHPISLGGAVDAMIPSVDHCDLDPCTTIKTGNWVRVWASDPGKEAIIEVFPNKETADNYPRDDDHAPQTGEIPANGWDKEALNLSPYEEEMLQGVHGAAKQTAMQRLVRFAHSLGALRMVSIRSAHIFSDLKKDDMTMGAWPIFEEFTGLGASVVVPTTLESSFLSEEHLNDSRMPWNFHNAVPASSIQKTMLPVYENLKSMGVMIIPTCIPYMHLTVPHFGECHVTSESNHAANANIMTGARVNRDPANMVLYAAITGVMPEYGMHLAENRRGELLFEVDPELAGELSDVGDYVALGGAIGYKAVDRVPVVTGLQEMTTAQAKAFCACVSPALIYPMMHVVGITPEARTLEEAFGGKVPEDLTPIKVTRKDVVQVFNSIHQTDNPNIDGAIVGCPFLTIQELDDIMKLLRNKQVVKPLWIYTDYIGYAAAAKAGILVSIEQSGATVVHSNCPGMVIRKPEEAEKLVFATDSLKIATLMAGIGWPRHWLGTRDEVIEAAITGRFIRKRWVG